MRCTAKTAVRRREPVGHLLQDLNGGLRVACPFCLDLALTIAEVVGPIQVDPLGVRSERAHTSDQQGHLSPCRRKALNAYSTCLRGRTPFPEVNHQ